jgi:hypothetical protein
MEFVEAEKLDRLIERAGWLPIKPELEIPGEV